jgi:hypothetical protein
MDETQFDNLARGLAGLRSRRSALKTLLGGALGGAAVLVGAGTAGAAKPANPGKPSKPDCCPADAPTLCDLTCTPTPTDASNCGACGNVCQGGKICVGGACTCPSGQTDCAGTCVDKLSDVNNCGACSHVCPAGNNLTATCVQGVCGSCTPCADGCTGLDTDPNNCGACGNVCRSGACVSGACVVPASCTNQIQDGTESDVDCGGTCAACADGKRCQTGSDCAGRVCTNDGFCCDFADYTVCAGICVAAFKDPSNCGTCGNVCPQGTTCSSGHCV